MRRALSPTRNARPQTAAHELRYWRDTGLQKGISIYGRYLELFGLSPTSLAGKAVCDFGSGPFGGVLSVLENVDAYPLDTLAGEYNKLGVSRSPILPVNDLATTLESATCDVAFCTNALDHVSDPRRAVAELARIVKPGGRVYLHLHLRRADQLNKAHRYVVSEDDVREWVAKWFDIAALAVDRDWPNDEPELQMLYATLIRKS